MEIKLYTRAVNSDMIVTKGELEEWVRKKANEYVDWHAKWEKARPTLL